MNKESIITSQAVIMTTIMKEKRKKQQQCYRKIPIPSTELQQQEHK